MLKKEIPDIIILDIMMEPMDGWETPEKIKGNPATCRIHVLMFSAKKITPQEAEIHRINIGDFVSKPVNPKQLVEAISNVLVRRNTLGKIAGKANAAWIDQAAIDEYVSLRMSLEVDTNLLKVLKNSSELGQPDAKTLEEQQKSIAAIKARIRQGEDRLKELLAALGPVVNAA